MNRKNRRAQRRLRRPRLGAGDPVSAGPGRRARHSSRVGHRGRSADYDGDGGRTHRGGFRQSTSLLRGRSQRPGRGGRLQGSCPGDPCEVAKEWAVKNGARLEACIFPDRPETVEVTVAVPVSGPMSVLGPASASPGGSRAPAGGARPGSPEVEDPPEEMPAEEAPPTD